MLSFPSSFPGINTYLMRVSDQSVAVADLHLSQSLDQYRNDTNRWKRLFNGPVFNSLLYKPSTFSGTSSH